MTTACPRCGAQHPDPPPAFCTSCGEPLAAAHTVSDSTAGRARAVPATGTVPLLRPKAIAEAVAAAAAPAPSGPTGPFLILKTSNGDAQEYALGPRTTIGRAPTNTIRLADREVSKEHAIVERIGAEWVVRDLASSNGTFVNGKRVFEMRLRDGDELTCGSSKMIYRAANLFLKGGSAAVVRDASSTGVMARLDAKEVSSAQKAEFQPERDIGDEAMLRRDYERLRIGHEFARFVTGEREKAPLLEKILDVAFHMLPADSGVILLMDRETGTLNIEAVKQRTPDLGEVLLSDTLLQQVAGTREGVLTLDASADERFAGSQSIIARGIRSAMAVPLLSDGEVRGVIFLDTRRQIGAFMPKDLEVLSFIAAQAAGSIERLDLERKIEQDAATRAQLARFLSPALVEQAARGQIDMERGGKLVECTILFSDIRGFTSISEKMPAQETVRMLNEQFEIIVDAVFTQAGVLDKFIGDGVMAVWGAPVHRDDDAARALRAALDIQYRMTDFNEKRKAKGLQEILVGIGVHTGACVVGNMGSSKRLEYTAIGDTVNTSSRLCGVAAGGEVVASENTVQAAGEGFEVQAMPPMKVKGKEKPITVYRVVGQYS